MIHLKTILIFLIFSTTSNVFSQEIEEELSPELISYTNPEGPMPPDLMQRLFGQDPIIDEVLQNREKYRFQFIVSEIVESKSELYLAQTHDYSVPYWYFYPASMVKLPAAILSLEKLKEEGYSTNASLQFNRDFICGNMKFVDESRMKNLTFAQMIRELIIISNNTYYNSLYHFLTPERINQKLVERGFVETNIYKDFSGCEMPLNLKTHGFTLREKDSSKVYSQKQSHIELEDFAANYSYDSTKLFGSKNEYRGEIVNGPYDFNYNLEYSIKDIHATSMRLFFPQFFSENDRWDIREEDRQFLIKSMKSVPKELNEKKYLDKKKYPDNLYKYIVHGDENPKYDSIISYSKMGISYGFVTETAYIHDPKTNRRFLVTANIYVNSNDTVNDGKYEYDEFARPFFARFGQVLLGLD